MDIHEKLRSKNYMIGVPSRDRTFLIEKSGGVWRYPLGNHPCAVIVRETEEGKYRKILSRHHPSINLLTVPDETIIRDKRKKLLETAISHGADHLFIMDDDIALYFRDENLSSKYTSRAEDFQAMEAFENILYECMQLCDEEYPIVGLPLKQGSFTLKYTFPKNIPIIRFVCYHVPTLVKESIDIAGLGTVYMSDRYVQLALLEKGYRSVSNCRWCVGDPGTGYRGGVSSTRDIPSQEKSARALTERFPSSVSLKIKENGEWAERRLDCSINWKYYLQEEESVYIPSVEGMKKIGVGD